MQQGGDNGRIDTAGKPEDDLLNTDCAAYLLNAFFNDIAGGPQGIAVADASHEALDDALSLPCVGYFRVEL